MSKIINLLEELLKYNFLSGFECTDSEKQIPAPFKALGASPDETGNLMIVKKSENPNAKNVLIEAHLDTIGLCVKEILEGGFLALSSCGGFDPNILPGTEFNVISSKAFPAVATSVPPHILRAGGSDKKISVENIFLDCGFSSKSEAEKHISIGSPVFFSAPCKELKNGCISAPSLDNKAAVIALLLAAEKVEVNNNLIFLFSMGEESTSRGVKQVQFPFKPDIALVVDAGFGLTKGLNSDQCILAGQGPSISIADTLSRKASDWVIKTCEENRFPLQIVVEPGGTGTSATALQFKNGGIPCGLISIPLKYMHTPSELVYEKDIEKTVDLLCLLANQRITGFEEVNILG